MTRAHYLSPPFPLPSPSSLVAPRRFVVYAALSNSSNHTFFLPLITWLWRCRLGMQPLVLLPPGVPDLVKREVRPFDYPH